VEKPVLGCYLAHPLCHLVVISYFVTSKGSYKDEISQVSIGQSNSEEDMACRKSFRTFLRCSKSVVALVIRLDNLSLKLGVSSVSSMMQKNTPIQNILVFLDILPEVKVVKAVYRVEGPQLFQSFTVVLLYDHVKQCLGGL
jgi:hypothetical protein